MAKRISREVKIFWDMVLSEVTASERLDELPYFIRRLMVWLRDQHIELFLKVNKQVHWISKGYKLGSKVLDRMEVMLSYRPSLPPRAIADQVCSFFKINPVMRPLLIKEARRIKKRILMRRRRSLSKKPYLLELIGEEGKDCSECPIIKYFGLEDPME